MPIKDFLAVNPNDILDHAIRETRKASGLTDNNQIKQLFSKVQTGLNKLAQSDNFSSAIHRQQDGFKGCIKDLHEVYQTSLKDLREFHKKELNNISDQKIKSALAKEHKKEQQALVDALNTAGQQIEHAYHHALRIHKTTETKFRNDFVSKYIKPDNFGSKVALNVLAFGVGGLLYTAHGIQQVNNYMQEWNQGLEQVKNQKPNQFVYTADKHGFSFNDLEQRISTVQGGFAGLLKVENVKVEHDSKTDTYSASGTMNIPKDCTTEQKITICNTFFDNLLATKHPNDANRCCFQEFDLDDILDLHGEEVALAVAENIYAQEPNATIYGFYTKELEAKLNHAKTKALETRNKMLHARGLALEGEGYDPNLTFDKFKIPLTPSASIKPLEDKFFKQNNSQHDQSKQQSNNEDSTSKPKVR